MNKSTQVLLASTPLLLTPVLFYVLAEGVLNLGGGEKDILWIFPWLIWSIIFAISSYILIAKGRAVANWLRYSLTISILVLVVLFFLAYIVSLLGIA
jgi:hypothetical protein